MWKQFIKKIWQNPYQTCALGENSFLISQLVALHDFSHLRKAFQTSSSWCRPALPLVPLWGTELSSNTSKILYLFLSLHCGCGKDQKKPGHPLLLSFPCLPSALSVCPTGSTCWWLSSLWSRSGMGEWHFLLHEDILLSSCIFLIFPVPWAKQCDWYSIIQSEFKISEVKCFRKRSVLKQFGKADITMLTSVNLHWLHQLRIGPRLARAFIFKF